MKIKQLLGILLALFLSNVAAAQVVISGDSSSSADVLAFDQAEAEYKEVQKELKQMEKQKKELMELLESFEAKQNELVLRAEKLEATYDALNSSVISKSKRKSKSLPQVGSASTQLKEMQMSFNMQYLQLQQQMQRENRSYTAVSNIMKSKHDTAKNSISNVR